MLTIFLFKMNGVIYTNESKQKQSGYSIPGIMRNTTDSYAWIDDIVANIFCIEKYQLHWRTRERVYVLPRQVCMWWRKNNTNESLKVIGSRYGFSVKYDHATVLHACKTVQNIQFSDIFFRRQLEQVCSEADVYRKKKMAEALLLESVKRIMQEVENAQAITQYITCDDYRNIAELGIMSISGAASNIIASIKL